MYSDIEDLIGLISSSYSGAPYFSAMASARLGTCRLLPPFICSEIANRCSSGCDMVQNRGKTAKLLKNLC